MARGVTFLGVLVPSQYLTRYFALQPLSLVWAFVFVIWWRALEYPITEQRSGSDMTNDLWETESIEPFVFHFRQNAKGAGEV